MKKLLVVGGGVAGITLIDNIMKKKTALDITLIEPKDYFEVPYAGLRALTEPLKIAPSIRTPLEQRLPGIPHVRKKAKAIDGESLILEDGTALAFDFLVLATGSFFPAWSFLKGSEENMAERQKKYETEGAALEAAPSVMIIGGGPVGVELAGEIAWKWPGKEITIANGASRLLSGFSEKMSSRADSLLKGLGVKILNDTRLVKNEEGVWFDGEGKIAAASVIYPSLGIQVQSGWLREGSPVELDEKGFVIVGDDLRLPGRDNIFALGDLNNVPESKLGAFAAAQAKVTAANLAGILKDPDSPLKAYKPLGVMGMIPIGRKKGAVQLPFGHAHFMIGMKQKDLFVSKTIKPGY